MSVRYVYLGKECLSGRQHSRDREKKRERERQRARACARARERERMRKRERESERTRQKKSAYKIYIFTAHKNREIALLLATNRGCVVRCVVRYVSPKRNVSNNYNQ